MHHACVSQSPEAPDAIQALCDDGGDINVRDEREFTTLHRVANYRSLRFESLSPHSAAVIDKLSQKGVDIEARDQDGRTPLHVSCDRMESEGPDVVKIILAHRADPNSWDSEGQTPLHVAAQEFDLVIAEILIGHGADVHARDGRGQTALHVVTTQYFPVAFEEEACEMARMLLRRGVSCGLRESDSGWHCARARSRPPRRCVGERKRLTR